MVFRCFLKFDLLQEIYNYILSLKFTEGWISLKFSSHMYLSSEIQALLDWFPNPTFNKAKWVFVLFKATVGKGLSSVSTLVQSVEI